MPNANNIPIAEPIIIDVESQTTNLSDIVRCQKIINCRRCKIELGLFYNSYKNINKLFWIDLIKCEDNYYDQLINLQENKIKYKKNFKKYNENEKEIIDIQNKIRLEKIKLKIKFKIQKKGMLVRHVY